MNKKNIQDAILQTDKEQPIVESLENTINGMPAKDYVNARYEAFQEKMVSQQISQSRKAREPYRSKAGKKLVLALGIMIVLVALLTVSVVAFNPFKKFFEIFNIHDYTKGSEISYSETYYNNAYLHGTYSFLPENYHLKEERFGKNYHEQYFESNEGKIIHASTLLAEDTISVLNTEKSNPEEVRVGEDKGLYLKTKEDFQILQWVTGRYVNSIDTDDDNIRLDTLRKMAESRTKVNT